MNNCSCYRNKSVILKIVQPLLNLSENCLLVTCITNLKRIHEKLLKLSRPQIIDVKCEKNRNKLAILNFFQPLLNLSEIWSLVRCKTNLGRIHEIFFKSSRPQVNVNGDADPTPTPKTPNCNRNSPHF